MKMFIYFGSTIMEQLTKALTKTKLHCRHVKYLRKCDA